MKKGKIMARKQLRTLVAPVDRNLTCLVITILVEKLIRAFFAKKKYKTIMYKGLE